MSQKRQKNSKKFIEVEREEKTNYGKMKDFEILVLPQF